MTTVRSAAEELLRAEQCDASGAHDEAVDALARAAKSGDVEALTRLGKRLIVGNAAPLLPVEGAGLLVEATQRGGAEAAMRLAVLAAAGVYVEPGLNHALRLTAIAAQRGWRAAQSQLLVLTPDLALAAAAERVPLAPTYWKQLADSIDLEHWTAPPEGRTVHGAPLIRAFESLVPERACRWLIDSSRSRLRRSLVYDAVGGQEYASDTRTNSWAQFDLIGSELIHLLVQVRMQVACGLPLGNMEATAILHYATGQESKNHFDFVSPGIPNYADEVAKNGQRTLTFLVYLNDDYDGGETDFPELAIKHKGRRGQGLFFVNTLDNHEPDPRTLHAGRPPTQGEKWIVSQFIRSRRVLGA
jgi:prolyl 4-hydroxylase